MRTASVHHQKHEVRRLPANLKSKAAAFERHHGWCAPRTGILLAGAASHRATPVAAADDEGSFQHRRINNHAFRFVEQVLRNVVGNVEDFLHYRAAIVQTVGFLPSLGRALRRMPDRTAVDALARLGAHRARMRQPGVDRQAATAGPGTAYGHCRSWMLKSQHRGRAGWKSAAC